ncbi:MAG: FCD domain-containing protein [Solirubrobacteraceae bacterium]
MSIPPPPSRSSAPAQPSAYGRDLARLILARCEEPGFAPGGKLPTERELASEYGVSRTMLRNALTVLESEGRISREVGRGTFFRASGGATGSISASAPPPDVIEVGPADVMAARRLIEPQVLPLVVAYATQRDFDELRRCLEGGSRAQSAAEFELWDFALHHAIVAASRNQLILAMYGVVERARKGEIWGSLKMRNDSAERRATYQADHIELVEALCARERDRAIAAMELHLARVRSNLLELTPSGSAD